MSALNWKLMDIYGISWNFMAGQLIRRFASKLHTAKMKHATPIKHPRTRKAPRFSPQDFSHMLFKQNL